MGGQLLFELLQDRTFLLFLSNFSELSGEQVGQTGIDLIYHQIGTVAEILVENGEMVEYGQPLFRIA